MRVLAADDVGTIAAGCLLGESPLWLAGGPGTLLWVDCDRGDLHWRRGVAQSRAALAVAEPLVAVCARSDGGLVVLGGRTVYALDHPRAAAVAVAELPDEPAGVRFNDAKPGPGGRLWAGTVLRGTPGGGALWSYRPDEGLVRHWTGITHGNGIGWDAAGASMYVVDSGAGTLSRADVDAATGRPGPPTVLLRLDPTDGLPDGLAVDVDGCLWLAVWGGSCVLRVAPSGRVLGRVTVPARNPTSCAFVGPDLAVLAVTTAADDRDPSGRGGDVHLLRVGTTGVEVGAVAWPATDPEGVTR
jgi:sugar lactone lactonase YvrE